MTRIAEGLATAFTVKVLCGQPTYVARGTRGPHVEICGGVEIRRCYSTTMDKDRLFGRALNGLSLLASMLYHAVRRFRPGDVVLVVTNPPALPFLAAGVCWIRRSRCLLLIHDVYPEALVAAGLIRKGGITERCMSRVTAFLYRRMVRIVTLGRDMTTLVVAKSPHVVDRITPITNWADTETVHPRPRSDNALLRRLELTRPFVVQWAGNMGRTHALEPIAKAAETLHGADVHFLFVGAGGKKTWLEAEVARKQLTNVTILPSQPEASLGDVLNACDVAVIAFVRGMFGVSVPSRLYNVLAAGKPLIAVADPATELALVIREERVGWVVPVNDVHALVATIKEAQSNPSALAAMGHRARRAAESKYSFASVLVQYRHLIEECSHA